MRKSGAGWKFFPGFDEASPDVGAVGWFGMEQEALDGAAGGTSGEQTRGEHAGVVTNQDIARAQELGQVRENVVREGAAGPIDDE